MGRTVPNDKTTYKVFTLPDWLWTLKCLCSSAALIFKPTFTCSGMFDSKVHVWHMYKGRMVPR